MSRDQYPRIYHSQALLPHVNFAEILISEKERLLIWRLFTSQELKMSFQHTVNHVILLSTSCVACVNIMMNLPNFNSQDLGCSCCSLSMKEVHYSLARANYT